jgi:hypothetical protein
MLEIGPRSLELAVAQDDSTNAENGAFQVPRRGQGLRTILPRVCPWARSWYAAWTSVSG